MSSEKNRSKLILKHEWTTLPPTRPVTQDHVKNANLRLGLHGKGGHQLKKVIMIIFLMIPFIFGLVAVKKNGQFLSRIKMIIGT